METRAVRNTLMLARTERKMRTNESAQNRVETGRFGTLDSLYWQTSGISPMKC